MPAVTRRKTICEPLVARATLRPLALLGLRLFAASSLVQTLAAPAYAEQAAAELRAAQALEAMRGDPLALHDHAFPGRAQGGKAVIPLADNAGDERRRAANGFHPSACTSKARIALSTRKAAEPTTAKRIVSLPRKAMCGPGCLARARS